MKDMPFIVGIGGTALPRSSTEQALALAMRAADRLGANTRTFGREKLCQLPHYLSSDSGIVPAAAELVSAVREAAGIIIATPGYHGSISGLIKNAIDYLEDTAKDERPYFDGRPVGLIVTAYGWQATGSTLSAMRSIVHALRGWPTPLGVTINTSAGVFVDGDCRDDAVFRQITLLAKQVCDFSRALHVA